MQKLGNNNFNIILIATGLYLALSFANKVYFDINNKMIEKATPTAISSDINTTSDIQKVNKIIQDKKVVNPPKHKLSAKTIKNAVIHKKVKRWLHGKPTVVNILIIDPSATIVKPSFGSYFLNTLKRVKEIVSIESAIAGINASYFKQDNGSTLGMSIINNKIISGPLFRRVTFGITKDKTFKMGRVEITGNIKIEKNINLHLFNINLPVFSNTNRFTVFTDKFGSYTPKTSIYYSHIVVKHHKISYIKNSKVPIPKNGFVIVGPHKYVPKNISKNMHVDYTINLHPQFWNEVEYAIGGGPYLVKDGKIYIDKQGFSKYFLWGKEPRSAIGYTKNGKLILVTIDGRNEKVSEGATIPELARILWELGAYNAMNLDGGTSTQMVYKGRVVNNPTVKGGGKVNNALVIMLSH